jgi:hypothetical protein
MTHITHNYSSSSNWVPRAYLVQFIPSPMLCKVLCHVAIATYDPMR